MTDGAFACGVVPVADESSRQYRRLLERLGRTLKMLGASLFDPVISQREHTPQAD
jgi:hypothetical protein